MTALEKKNNIARWALLLCYIDLFLLFTVKTLVWPTQGRDPNVVIWLIHIVPLLFFIPGLINKNPRYYIGLCYVVLVYFISSGGNLMNPDVHIYDWLTVILCVLIYIAGLLASRWQKQLTNQVAVAHE